MHTTLFLELLLALVIVRRIDNTDVAARGHHLNQTAKELTPKSNEIESMCMIECKATAWICRKKEGKNEVST